MSERFRPMVDPPDAGDSPGVWLVVRTGEVLVVTAGDAVELPVARHPGELGVAGGGAHFLGRLGDRPVWALDVEVGAADGADHGTRAPVVAGGSFEQLRSLHGRVDDVRWALAGRAVQIVEWARTHRFCGRCGDPTQPQAGERARRCPSCGLLAFPRLAPAVIVTIERDDEILLARGRSFPIPMYSALAGFVEPGETLEEAVHREVEEEVGVTLAGLRYFGSQPWPFPNSLMIGFTARWAGGEIRIDEREIADAQWFRAGSLPMIPPRMSIARLLIDDWLARAGA